MLEEHGLSDINDTYRESVARTLRGPELFALVDDLHH
jgi:hypothetical protein